MIPLQFRTVDGLFRDAAEAAPTASFLFYRDSHFTYGEAFLQVGSVAGALQAGGVGRGTHVAILLDNSPEHVWTFFALARIGAVAIPINTAVNGELLRHYLLSSDAQVLVAEAAYIDRVSDALGDESWRIKAVYFRGTEAARLGDARSFPLNPPSAGQFPTVECDRSSQPRDTLALMFTSGTSGPSKAAIVPNAQAVTTGCIVADGLALEAEDRLYTCLPMYHANALWYTILPTVIAHASLVLADRFSASGFWGDIDRYRPSEANMMGTMMQILGKREPTQIERSSSLRAVLVVPLPDDPEAFAKRYNAQASTTYALTEALPVSISALGDAAVRGSSTGMVVPPSIVRIVDENDHEVSAGEEGEITLRSSEPWTMSQGYYGRPEDTLNAWRNLWFHTGDRGYIDPDGYLNFVSRMTDSIRRRGENISCYELEHLLADDPQVHEVAALAVPSELGEDDVALFVVAANPGQLTPDDVFAIAERILPRYMRPSHVFLVENLPKTSTSKVQKFRLLEEYAAKSQQRSREV